MNKGKINTSIYERCLLTEVTPYETPLMFSNWGAFNYYRNLKCKNIPNEITKIMECSSPTIPFNYHYYKDLTKKRTLSLIHPGASKNIIELYEKYEVLILRLTQKSLYSIRYPHSVAKYFITSEGKRKEFDFKSIEQLDENQPFASSYFAYMHYSHLHKYFESDAFTEIEKNFRFQKHLDVSKCFSSIYTHSISWATRGKIAAKKRKINIKKDKSFDSAFDQLMQYANHQETNGIIIGPEISRIFAEIIFQEIDRKVEAKMKEKGFRHELDYECSRYIDDYFLHYNKQSISEQFMIILRDELELFKLYLNDNKIEDKTRPFISDISVKKLSISNYINELTDRLSLQNNVTINSQKEINKIRNILNSNPAENHAITNFFLAALLNRIYIIKKVDEDYAIKVIKLFIDLVFYWIRTDTRVTSIYKLIEFILVIIDLTKKYKQHERVSIIDKLYYELCETIKATIHSDASVELMNLLIAVSVIGEDYFIDKELLNDIIKSCRESNYRYENNSKIMNYFEITSILYYIKKNSEFEDQKKEVLNDSKKILSYYSILEYSESAHLIFDLISCPYLDKDIKRELVQIAFETCEINTNNGKIYRFINFVKNESWYTNWESSKNQGSIHYQEASENQDIIIYKDSSFNIRNILQKKKYMLSY